MSRILTLGLLAFSLVLFSALPVLAQNGGQAAVKTLLQERDTEIKAIVGTGTLGDSQREKLRDLVNDAVDFRSMSQAALGETWIDLTTAQKDEFVELFSTIVRSQSLADLKIYRAKVAYDAVKVDGKFARAATTARYDDVTSKVDYELAYDEKGKKWVITDIIIDGVGTVEGYQRSFERVVKRKGFDTLLKSLRKKAEKVS